MKQIRQEHFLMHRSPNTSGRQSHKSLSRGEINASTSAFNTSRLETDSQYTSHLTVAAVRQTRVRIENDVVKMHNRIHLLQ